MKHATRFSTPMLAFALAAGMTANIPADNTEQVNDSGFTTKIDNPFFPLVPGTTFIYEGTKDGSPTRDEFAVTKRTKVIMGVTCREISDRVFVDGFLEEDTLDWFAQDAQGAVWS